MTRESKEEQKKFEDFDGGEGSGGVSGKSVSRFSEPMEVEGAQVVIPGEPGASSFSASSNSLVVHGSGSASSASTSSGFSGIGKNAKL